MNRSNRWTTHARLLVSGALLVLASSAQAQSVVLGPQGVERSDRLGRAFQTFSVFGGTPGIAAAQYYSDFQLNSYQLPITHSFSPITDGIFAGISPYVEFTLGYLTANQTFPLLQGTASPSAVKLSFNSWSTLGGAGVDVPLGNGFTFRPIALLGYSHVGGDARFFGPNAELFGTFVRGTLSDASLGSILVGGALELTYETDLPDDLTLRGQVRYNQLATLVTNASSRALDGNDDFSVVNASVTLSGPVDWRIGANPVNWIGYVKGSWLANTDPGVLGFNSFVEIGGGLQIVAPDVVRGVQGATVRASAIVGPGVTGWLVSAALDF